jgi:hypothetical protein
MGEMVSGTISSAPAVPHPVFRIIKWFLTPFLPNDDISVGEVERIGI